MPKAEFARGDGYIVNGTSKGGFDVSPSVFYPKGNVIRKQLEILDPAIKWERGGTYSYKISDLKIDQMKDKNLVRKSLCYCDDYIRKWKRNYYFVESVIFGKEKIYSKEIDDFYIGSKDDEKIVYYDHNGNINIEDNEIRPKFMVLRKISPIIPKNSECSAIAEKPKEPNKKKEVKFAVVSSNISEEAQSYKVTARGTSPKNCVAVAKIFRAGSQFLNNQDGEPHDYPNANGNWELSFKVSKKVVEDYGLKKVSRPFGVLGWCKGKQDSNYSAPRGVDHEYNYPSHDGYIRTW